MGRCHRLCLSVGLISFLYSSFRTIRYPSSSLEKSLLVGDFLLVSKMSYGPRVPNTPLHFPLAQHTIPLLNTKSYIEWPQWDYHRLKGFGPVKRNDIVVFNFPAGDTVAVKQPNPDYYTLCFLEGRESRKPQQGSVRRYYLPSGRSSGKLCETMCGLTGRHVQHCQ